jgi:Glycosyl transferase family 11
VADRKKIIINLQGGLGNQLFCYSAGYYVATKNHFDLECQMTSQFNSTKRDESILLSLKLPGFFTIPRQVSTPNNAILNRILRKIYRKFESVTNVRIKPNYFSDDVGYDKNLELINTTTHLHGYFQTWRYPTAAREVILEALKNEIALSEYALRLIGQMKSSKILVIHIRLGDYRLAENSFIGVLSPSYYSSVLQREDVQGYGLFVFSDDINAAKIEYGGHFPDETNWIDESDTLSPLETLIVMSHGSAFAIANSTYSWWSAFLGENPEVVIVPKEWFRKRKEPRDLIPIDWRREVSQWVD